MLCVACLFKSCLSARELSIEAALGDAARIARRITRVANHTDRAATATAAVAAHAGAAV